MPSSSSILRALSGLLLASIAVAAPTGTKTSLASKPTPTGDDLVPGQTAWCLVWQFSDSPSIFNPVVPSAKLALKECIVSGKDDVKDLPDGAVYCDPLALENDFCSPTQTFPKGPAIAPFSGDDNKPTPTVDAVPVAASSTLADPLNRGGQVCDDEGEHCYYYDGNANWSAEKEKRQFYEPAILPTEPETCGRFFPCI